MKKKDKLFTLADIVFTLICFITVVVWYLHVPYRAPVTIGLVIFAIVMFSFFKKGYDAESKSDNALLKDQLNTDALTGLLNRNYFDHYLTELTHSKKDKFALLLLDIDGLKFINKSIGHNHGDTLLKLIAERIKRSVRSEDKIARIGGDEFAFVIENFGNVEIIAKISQKILGSLLHSMQLDDHEVNVTGSVGIALYPNDGEDSETLFRNANFALEKAKLNKGNNYQFCLDEMTRQAQEQSKQRSALSTALAKNELQLYYQPSVMLADQRVSSVEALIRWNSDVFGLVMPDKLIPLAEESGLIIPISEWIIRAACKQVRIWQDQWNSQLKLSLNISAYQFKNNSFTNNIIRAIKESEISPDSIILEIKESLVMHDHVSTAETLRKIKEAGIGISVDNFGSGFSSFAYLTDYDVDKIKIDQQIVQKVEKDDHARSIVSAMISMAKALHIKTVASGVETQGQLDLLTEERCDEVQGYYIAKPLPVELMETFLSSQQLVVDKLNKGLMQD